MAKYIVDNGAVNTYLADLKSKIQASLNALHTGFQALKADGFHVDSIAPMGAIYLTIQIDYTSKTAREAVTVLKNSTDINFYLIKQAGIAFVPFSAFSRYRRQCS